MKNCRHEMLIIRLLAYDCRRSQQVGQNTLHVHPIVANEIRTWRALLSDANNGDTRWRQSLLGPQQTADIRYNSHNFLRSNSQTAVNESQQWL